MATLQELESALVKADAAGNADDARALTRAIDQMRTAAPQPAAPASQPSAGFQAPPEFMDGRPAGQYGRVRPQPKDAPSPIAAFGGPSFSPEMRQARVEQTVAETAPVVKYGPLVAASMATAGAPLAVQTAASGASMFGGSLASGEAPRTAAAEGLLAMTPMVRFNQLTPFMPKGKVAVELGKRIGAQIPLTAAVEQGAQAIEGTYQAPKDPAEFVKSLFTPTTVVAGALSGVGGAVEGLAASARGAQAVRAGRGEQTGLLASELSESFIPLEARRIVSGDPKARAAMRDLYTDIDQTILQTYANAPDSNQIAAQIAPAVGKLKELQGAARLADQAAQQAEELRRASVGRAGVDMAKIAEDATAKAAEAARTKALLELGIDRAFGPSRPTPTLAALSPSENTEALSDVIKTTFEAQQEGLGQLYRAAGIDLNAPVIDKATLLSEINKRAGSGTSLLRGNDARRAAIAQVESLFTDAGADTLTLEQFRLARNAIANGLSESKLFSSSAQRLAGDTYDAFRTASNDYIKRNASDAFPAWQQANETAANFFKARESSFIQDFVDPSTGVLRQGKAKAFVDRLISGETEGFDALSKLGDSIAANGDTGSVAAATLFKDSVASYISKGILDSAVANRTLGAAADTAVFDTAKLYQTVNKLASRRYPVENLGLGAPKDLNALARMAGNGFVSKAEVDDFFRNVGTLGGDAAAARIAYRREITKNLLGAGSKNVTENVRRQTELARKAKMDAATATAELNAAKQDPLVVLFGDGSFNFTGDLTSSDLGAAVGKLRTVEGSQVRRFMDAAQAKNPALAEQIRARTAADLFAQYSDTVPGLTPEANIAGIRNFFFNTGDEYAKQRRAVREIMGPQEYKNFQDLAVKIGGRARAEAQLVRQVGQTVTKPDDALRGAIAAGSLARGNAVTGTILAANIGNVRKFLDNGQYSALYYLYIRPDTARKFASASYNLDKFLNQNGVHRVALQIAERQDKERAQQMPE